ncbi:hypothetical protein KBD81_03965, partial [Candidatus Woesebacteria bacterium]|nr:hypothetical protein [Candidatus Woesebacteria bacterium]
MSLTYAQKRDIQDQFSTKSVDEIASNLGISRKVIEKHMAKNPKIFLQQKEGNSQLLPVSEKISYLILLGMIVIAVYINGMWNAFVSDDIFVIVNYEDLLQSVHYFLIQPTMLIRNIQFFLAYQIGGLTPFFFRLPNLMFHMGFVSIVYLIMPFFSKHKYLPFIVAVIAAVHPMMVESVTWISGGIYSQAAFFAVLSLYLYLRGSHQKKSRFYIYSAIVAFIAMTSSEKTIIFPFIILLYEFSFGNLKSAWRRITAFFGISLVWGIVLLGQVNSRLSYLQVTNGSASKFQFNNPFIQVPVALSKYLELFTWPDKLTLYQSEYAMGPLQFGIRATVTILFFVIIAISYKKNRPLFFWLSFFFITLLTTLN